MLVKHHYLGNIFVSTLILFIACIVSLFTNSFSTKKCTVLLFCISILIASYMLRRNRWKPIISEIHNRRTGKLLLLKDSVNIRMCPPYLNAISSTRKLRRRHIAVTWNHLPPSYQNIFRTRLLRSL